MLVRGANITLGDSILGRYDGRMIKSFHDAETGLLWEAGDSQCVPPKMRQGAWRRLAVLNAAVGLQDLRVAPGFAFDSIDMGGVQICSLQVGGRYQACFRWEQDDADQGHAYDVAIVAC